MIEFETALLNIKLHTNIADINKTNSNIWWKFSVPWGDTLWLLERIGLTVSYIDQKWSLLINYFTKFKTIPQ